MSGINTTWKVVLLQAVVTCVVAAFCFNSMGIDAVQASWFGGGLAMLHAWMLGRRVRLATEAAKAQPGSETTVMYLGAIERFVVTLLAFGLGMGLLKLMPVPMLIAFAAAQVVFFMSRNMSSIRSNSAHGEPKGG
ncbi:MAG: ATP synthase subunit I [Gammaproteobacteria bacterium]|nr:ATP synthase subunit I [Gammaproteobacteria bacterium]